MTIDVITIVMIVITMTVIAITVMLMFSNDVDAQDDVDDQDVVDDQDDVDVPGHCPAMMFVVTSLWVASATTVSRSRERLKKLPWVPPETLIVVSYNPGNCSLEEGGCDLF